MPFGCLALRDGRNYNSLSDVTDKYEIGQVLRAKEFCELCLAKDRQTDKVFVCKKFLKKDGKKVRKAAKNEIMILKMVNHPNILQLIDTYETRKEYFIIQELATGGDVFDWILDQGNYTERDASNVIRQVLEAVAYLHSLNIVHRNLKLENLMYYTENNHKKVVLRDFYLSKFENGSITEPCGTPEYLAPEVVARHRYGRPVDCWAVGVIMYILLSGNPPFYDETEEENTDLHNRIIFCRIVAGEYEFDSPYWDDISSAAKELVCRLMEVDQMLRITAQDALWHEWIAGNGASEKNLKDGVCAQFEKNFAKAKWRKAIRVTTFMQRLKNSEALNDGVAEAAQRGRAENQGVPGEGEGCGKQGNVSLEVTVENSRAGEGRGEERNGGGGVRKEDESDMSVGGHIIHSPSVGISPSATQEPLAQPNQLNAHPKTAKEEQVKGGLKSEAGDGIRNLVAALGQKKAAMETASAMTPDTPGLTNSLRSQASAPSPDPTFTPPGEKQTLSSSPDTTSHQEMDATLHGPASATVAPPEKRPVAQGEEKGERKKEDSDGSWCQTQLPEAVAERPVVAGVAVAGLPVAGVGPEGSPGDWMRSDVSPVLGRDRGEARRTDRYSAEFSMARGGPTTAYSAGNSASLGRHATPYNPEVGAAGLGMTGGYGSPYSLYTGGPGVGMYGTGLDPGRVGMGGGSSSTTSDWQMDSVIEQIEMQMAAVLEKIEGDMPSLLEQISDCPPEPPCARSMHASPASRTRSSHSPAAATTIPPPLPTSPRPPLPSLPHLTIPPPSYPPPSPPTQSPGQGGEQEESEGQRGTARSSPSPRAGMGRGP
ncbi:caM kinase-like vesicle-associated, like [Aplochiton taeniatus]